jgi:hypothetical protein
MGVPQIFPRAAHDVGIGQGPSLSETPRVGNSPPQRLLARRLALCRQSR